MNSLKKQTVYLPVKVEDELPEKEGKFIVLSRCNTTIPLESYDTLNFQNGKFQLISNWTHIHWLKPQELFIFTPDQLNKYTQSVIKQSLETAAKKAKIEYVVPIEDGCHDYKNTFEAIDEKSIIDTFEETFNKFKLI